MFLIGIKLVTNLSIESRDGAASCTSCSVVAWPSDFESGTRDHAFLAAGVRKADGRGRNASKSGA